MFYLVSLILTIAFLLAGIFQTSLPTVYSVMKDDFERTVSENAWLTGVKYADMAIRAGTPGKVVAPQPNQRIEYPYPLGFVNGFYEDPHIINPKNVTSCIAVETDFTGNITIINNVKYGDSCP